MGQTNETWSRGSRVVPALLLSAALIALAMLAGCKGLESVAPQVPAHPSVAAGQACSSCKAPQHDFKHVEPYDNPDCASCHTLDSWTRVTHIHTVDAFNDGFHAVVGCSFCHTKKVLTPSPECQTCHEPQHALIKPCSRCHNANTWRILNALPMGHISLSGGHSKLTCFSCHTPKRGLNAPKACVSCHGTNHGGLTDCARCHDPRLGWKPKAGFNHDAFFPLTGRHRTLPCGRCHPNDRFAGTSPNCASCHGVKHGGLRDCSACHTTSSFKPSTFRHSTRFTLVGAHARLACTECHPGGRFADSVGPAGPCVGCHGVKHGGLRDCAKCHTTTSFIPSTFRHSTVFRLTGAHARLRCSKCHPRNLFARVIGDPSRCTNCHGVMHGNQIDCAKCHTTTAFSPAKKVAHPVWPPVSGKHAEMACTLCHPTLIFNAPVRPCSDCHAPVHVAPSNCLQCHTPTVWPVLHDDIGYHTSFPITDVCQDCHANTSDYTQTYCLCHGL